METAEEPRELLGKHLVRKLLVTVAIAVVAYAGLLFYGDAASIRSAMRELPGSALGLCLVLSIVSLALRSVRWHRYLAAAGITLPIVDGALIFLAGVAMSITPGKVGEIVKSLLLKESSDVPVAKSAPLVVAERVADLGALLTLGAASIAWLESPGLALPAAALGLFAFYGFGRSQRLASFVITKLARLRPLAPYREKLLTAHAALYNLWRPGAYVTAMLLSLASWGLQAVIVMVLYAGLAHAELDAARATIVYAAPVLAGALALLPGGLGLTELSMTGALRALGGLGATQATTLTIVLRCVTFWFSIVLGLLGLAAFRARQRRR